MTDEHFPKQRGRRPKTETLLEPIDDDDDLSDDLEADYEEMMKSLRDQAKKGDPAARKLYLELISQQRSASAMDFRLHITPYDIADKKISFIVQRADVPVVLDVFIGITQRMEVDNFSPDTQKTFINFRNLFEADAARIYKPPEE